MTREVGYYSVKRTKYWSESIAFWDGQYFFVTGDDTFYQPDEFFWISDKKIEPEKMPVLLEKGKYYVYSSESESEKMIGKYMGDSHVFWGMRSVYSNEVKVLAGPFTLEELVNMKPL